MPSREVISQMVAEFGVVDTGFASGVQRVERSMESVSTTSNMHMQRVAAGVNRMSTASLKDMDNLASGMGMMAQGFGAARLGAIGFAAAVGIQAGNAINMLVKSLTGTDISEKLAALFGEKADKGGEDPEVLAKRAKRQAAEFQKALQLAGQGIDMSKTFFTPDEMKTVAASGMQDMINKMNSTMSTPENKIKMALWTHKDLEEQKKKAEETAKAIADVKEQRAQWQANKEIDRMDQVIKSFEGRGLDIGGDAKSLWGKRAQSDFDKPKRLAEAQRDWLQERENSRRMLEELKELNDNLTKNGLLVVT